MKSPSRSKRVARQQGGNSCKNRAFAQAASVTGDSRNLADAVGTSRRAAARIRVRIPPSPPKRSRVSAPAGALRAFYRALGIRGEPSASEDRSPAVTATPASPSHRHHHPAVTATPATSAGGRRRVRSARRSSDRRAPRAAVSCRGARRTPPRRCCSGPCPGAVRALRDG